MKAVKHFTVCLLLALMTFYSCSKERVKEAIAMVQDDLPLNSEKSPEKTRSLAWYPEGSETIITESSVLVKPADGWSYIGYDKNGRVIQTGSEVMTKISCTCNTSGECNPFKASGPGGSFSGCGGDCKNCTMLQSVFMNYDGSTVYSGGYYNPNFKTRLLKKEESRPAVFDALFEVKEFQNELLRLYKDAYSGKPFVQAIRLKDGSVTAPKGYCLAGVEIFGRGMMVILPVDYIKSNSGNAITYSASCGCSEGNCSLKDKSVLGVGAIWCGGNCTGTCTLNTEFANKSLLSAFQY